MTPEERKAKDEDIARVQRALDTLSEHFDAVQIFATTHRGDLEGTTSINLGGGNWYARYGKIREWVFQEEERFRDYVRDKNP